MKRVTISKEPVIYKEPGPVTTKTSIFEIDKITLINDNPNQSNLRKTYKTVNSLIFKKDQNPTSLIPKLSMPIIGPNLFTNRPKINKNYITILE